MQLSTKSVDECLHPKSKFKLNHESLEQEVQKQAIWDALHIKKGESPVKLAQDDDFLAESLAYIQTLPEP